MRLALVSALVVSSTVAMAKPDEVTMPAAVFREYVRASRAEEHYRREIAALRRALAASELEADLRAQTATATRSLADLWRTDALTCRAAPPPPCSCSWPALIGVGLGAAAVVGAGFAIKPAR